MQESQRVETISPAWPAPATVRAAFATRRGGASAAPFDSLNLSTVVPDSSEAVSRNRRLLTTHLGTDAPVCWLHQVHGTKVVNAAEALHAVPRAHAVPQADGACTDRADVVCAALAADCLPVLFCDRDGQRVGAVHAGWRGLAAGVVESGVAAMGRLRAPPDTLLAWLGPCIGRAVYEVGDEVRAAFHADEQAAAFRPSPAGRWLADLPALARLRLRAAGVDAIYGEPPCTYSDPQRYFSHRRDGPCGRMAALIWLTAE